MWQRALGVFLLCQGIYLYTLAPELAPGHDTGELVTAACLPGVAHPPGYPLYTMLGYLFSLLPVGSPAYRLNFMSSFFSALAASLGCLAFERASRNPWGSVAASLAFGLAQTPWRQAVGAEKYSLHLALLAGLLVLSADWVELKPEERARRLPWLAFVFGLALSHHHTILLAIPGLALLLLRFRPSSWKGAGCVVLGLLPYLYVPLRALQQPALNWGDPSTPARFWWSLTRAGYGGVVLNQAADASWGGQQLAHYFQSLMVVQFPLLGLVAGMAYRRRWLAACWGMHWIFMGPGWALYTGQPLEESYFDLLERFYAASYLPFAGLIALGMPPRWGKVTVPVALVLGLTHLPACSLRGQYQPADLMETILDRLPAGCLYLPGSDLSSGGALYYQLVLHQHTDVQVIFPGLIGSPWYRQQHPKITGANLASACLAWRLAGKELYFDAIPPAVPGFFVPDGLCYRYLAPGEELPDRVATETANRTYLQSRSHRGDFFYRPQQTFWQHDCLARWARAYRSVGESLQDADALRKAADLEAPERAL